MPKAASRSVVRRRNLSNNILAIGRTLDHPCSRCAKSHKECFVDLCTGHCAHCVSLGRVCDSVEMNSDCSFFVCSLFSLLANFFAVGRLLSEKEKLCKQAREAEDAAARSMAKAARLRRQLDFLEGRTADVLSKELSAIEELEKAEAESSKDAVASSSAEPPGSSSAAPGIDWGEWDSLLGSVGGNAVQASNNT